MSNTILSTSTSAILFPIEQKDYSVSDISKEIQTILETKYKQIRIKGELSGVKLHTSGHLYYTIKDVDSTLDGVCWRGSVSRLKIQPKDGLEVIITGKISTFAARSKYLVVAEQIEESGVGLLQRKFHELKEKLEKEGLFSQDHKKHIPKLPQTIGIITSPTGAVIQDLIHRLKERYTEKVFIWPTLVQGDGSIEQIITAIEGFNSMTPKPDVIIIARGGGSIEDLWSFNEEAVVRAVYKSSIPIISAVGHETDTTLCDLVADLRSPTPSAAGEIVASKKSDVQIYLQNKFVLALQIINSRLENAEQRLNNNRIINPLKSKQQKILKLDDLSLRLNQNLKLMFHVKQQIIFNKTLSPNNIILKVERLDKDLTFYSLRLAQIFKTFLDTQEIIITNLGQMLEAYSFKKTLERGFTLVRSKEGHVITTTKEFLEYNTVRVMFKDGELDITPK